MAGFNYPASKINAKQITKTLIFVQFCGRPPHRGAWIEIFPKFNLIVSAIVAPRTGGRGLKWENMSKPTLCGVVAPRTGGRGLK